MGLTIFIGYIWYINKDSAHVDLPLTFYSIHDYFIAIGRPTIIKGAMTGCDSVPHLPQLAQLGRRSTSTLISKNGFMHVVIIIILV